MFKPEEFKEEFTRRFGHLYVLNADDTITVKLPTRTLYDFMEELVENCQK